MTAKANNIIYQPSLIVRLAIKQIQSGFYEYQVLANDLLLYEDSGYESISAALMAASVGHEREFLGYEVAYNGITIGTYPSNGFTYKAKFIADQAVETVASLHP